MSGSVTTHVEHQSYPLPDLFQYQTSPRCANATVVLDPAPGYTYSTYLWSTGETTPSIQVGGPSNSYSVTVTKGSCTEIAYCSLEFYKAPVQPEICIVTVDPVVNKNMIVWTADNEPMQGDPEHSQIASYNIYKWAGGSNWTLLGNVPVSHEHSFVDITSNPASVSARYKITMVDTCGEESLKSWYHQTILLSVMTGGNPNEVPLIWTPYNDESGNFVVDQYQIYRGSLPDNLVYYDQTPFTSYNDLNVLSQKYYQIVAIKSSGCDPSPASGKGTKTIITGSFSNITHNIISGVTDNSQDINVSICPNPSIGSFHVKGEGIISIVVTDMVGREILSTEQHTFDLGSFGSGIYNARITTKNGSTDCKLVVIH
jgi:hypothetical protein